MRFILGVLVVLGLIGLVKADDKANGTPPSIAAEEAPAAQFTAE